MGFLIELAKAVAFLAATIGLTVALVWCLCKLHRPPADHLHDILSRSHGYTRPPRSGRAHLE